MKLFEDENTKSVKEEIADTISVLCHDIRGEIDNDEIAKKADAIIKLVFAYRQMT